VAAGRENRVDEGGVGGKEADMAKAGQRGVDGRDGNAQDARAVGDAPGTDESDGSEDLPVHSGEQSDTAAEEVDRVDWLDAHSP
jgi:hypothetical protein